MLALPLNLRGAVGTGVSVRPSVRDVAAHAGVSVGTVSHVLNHPERVSEATRKRVEGAIASLGFVRSETARRLRDRGSSVVGVVVHDVSNPFFTEAARGIEDRLRESGYVPMLCSSDADSAREQEILSLLVGMSLRGVIIMPSATTLDRLGMLVERGIRVVLLDHPPIPEMSTVVGDDVAGARAAISHLLEIGHRRIGFVNGPLAIRQAKDRRRPQGAHGERARSCRGSSGYRVRGRLEKLQRGFRGGGNGQASGCSAPAIGDLLCQ